MVEKRVHNEKAAKYSRDNDISLQTMNIMYNKKSSTVIYYKCTCCLHRLKVDFEFRYCCRIEVHSSHIKPLLRQQQSDDHGSSCIGTWSASKRDVLNHYFNINNLFYIIPPPRHVQPNFWAWDHTDIRNEFGDSVIWNTHTNIIFTEVSNVGPSRSLNFAIPPRLMSESIMTCSNDQKNLLTNHKRIYLNKSLTGCNEQCGFPTKFQKMVDTSKWQLNPQVFIKTHLFISGGWISMQANLSC